jgi:hypothetical protein
MLIAKRMMILALMAFPATAAADLAPIDEDVSPPTFQGTCACELACNGSSLKFFRIGFLTKRAADTTSPSAAHKACQDEARELRGLKGLGFDLTPRQATSHFCQYGGKGAKACTLDGACAENRVECFSLDMKGLEEP